MESRKVLVPVALQDGTVIKVTARREAMDEDVVDLRKVFSFENVSRTVEGITKEVMLWLERVKPDKATVEFGIEIAVEQGTLTALLVDGSAKGTMTISLEWSGGPKAEKA